VPHSFIAERSQAQVKKDDQSATTTSSSPAPAAPKLAEPTTAAPALDQLTSPDTPVSTRNNDGQPAELTPIVVDSKEEPTAQAAAVVAVVIDHPKSESDKKSESGERTTAIKFDAPQTPSRDYSSEMPPVRDPPHERAVDDLHPAPADDDGGDSEEGGDDDDDAFERDWDRVTRLALDPAQRSHSFNKKKPRQHQDVPPGHSKKDNGNGDKKSKKPVGKEKKKEKEKARKEKAKRKEKATYATDSSPSDNEDDDDDDEMVEETGGRRVIVAPASSKPGLAVHPGTNGLAKSRSPRAAAAPAETKASKAKPSAKKKTHKRSNSTAAKPSASNTIVVAGDNLRRGGASDESDATSGGGSGSRQRGHITGASSGGGELGKQLKRRKSWSSPSKGVPDKIDRGGGAATSSSASSASSNSSAATSSPGSKVRSAVLSLHEGRLTNNQTHTKRGR
jgi:hypothetical protein